jgi:Tfp pilus assembly protein PilF
VNYLVRLRIVIQVLVPLIIVMLLGVSSGWRMIDRQLYRARQAIEANDSQQASLALAQAAQYAPWRKDLWEQAGIYALQDGQHQTAKAYFLRVDNPGDLSSTGLTALGDIAQFEGDIKNAIRLWEEALTAGNGDIELHTRLAEAYQQLGDLDYAIQHLTALVTLNPGESVSIYQLGLLLAATQPQSSLAYLSLAAELDTELSSKTKALTDNIRFARNIDDPSYPLVSAGQSLASIEEWELAEIALSKATQLNPEYADAWAYLGEALQHTDQNGLDELEKALSIDPNSVAANTFMGLYWQRQEQYALALIYLHAAAKLDDLNPALQAELGNTLGLLGNISHYRRAAALAPNGSTYWRILANYYIKYETKIREEGLAAARQAVILDPEDSESLDAIAQIYLLLDSPFIARRFLERAIAADDNFAPAHLHLGLIHILEGNTLEAFQQFSIAKTLSPPGSQTAEQATRLLETYFP